MNIHATILVSTRVNTRENTQTIATAIAPMNAHKLEQTFGDGALAGLGGLYLVRVGMGDCPKFSRCG